MHPRTYLLVSLRSAPLSPVQNQSAASNPPILTSLALWLKLSIGPLDTFPLTADAAGWRWRFGVQRRETGFRAVYAVSGHGSEKGQDLRGAENSRPFRRGPTREPTG